MDIQWFPGHMAKTRKMMEENIRLVDAVLEVVDARIPYSSKNPYLDALWSKKPRLMLLNKVDLADPAATNQWMQYYRSRGFSCVLIDSLHGKGVAEILPAVKELCRDVLENEKAKGRLERPLRVMICGIPNVGKSTLINRLCKRSEAAKTGNMPGVTKAKQWIKLHGNIEMLDTPGMLWPKFENQTMGFKIASIGSINDDALELYDVACFILEQMQLHYPKLLTERYKLTAEELQIKPQELLLIIGRHRGFLQSGGRVDWERAVKMILEEFRNGKMGRLSLERPVEIEVQNA